eukprot:TRINITY_DN2508_c0_g1_i4.p1 TRINITY_DN2508_c0_g1~~TRINITY_DN2508_c0_g1_i4.p1  ORF type:complete len:258 (-),score=65.22 TRINITY_DN2508_c0_g1_i4:752-1525(-)
MDGLCLQCRSAIFQKEDIADGFHLISPDSDESLLTLLQGGWIDAAGKMNYTKKGEYMQRLQSLVVETPITLPSICSYCLTTSVQPQIKEETKFSSLVNEQYKKASKVFTNDCQVLSQYADVDVHHLDTEEKDLLLEISTLLEVCQEIKKEEIEALQKQKDLEVQEMQFWEKQNEQKRIYQNVVEVMTLDKATLKVEKELDIAMSLPRAHTDVFCLTTEPPIGTVNGLRFGLINQNDPPWDGKNFANSFCEKFIYPRK